MTDAGWARKVVAEVETETGYVWFGAAMDMVEAEHARSVRIVKRLMKGYINKNFNGQFYDRIDTCEYILHLLQRGRGGKG